ncbi:hypothetical protein HDU67_006931 [Dinochytrium kinnereticum]|nr:hypothetical protein HDU67_006931 [Dinochytrium kinnereticum]
MQQDHLPSVGELPDRNGLDQDGIETFEDVVAERNQLRQDNDRLWQIVERQQALIQELKLQIAASVAVTDHVLTRPSDSVGGLQLPEIPEDSHSASSVPSVSSFIPLQIPDAGVPRISLDFSTLAVSEDLSALVETTGPPPTFEEAQSHEIVENEVGPVQGSVEIALSASELPVDIEEVDDDQMVSDEDESPSGSAGALGPSRAVRRREAQRRKAKEETKRANERDLIIAKARETEIVAQKLEAMGGGPASALLQKSAAIGAPGQTMPSHSRSSSLGYTEAKMGNGVAPQQQNESLPRLHKRSGSVESTKPLPPDVVITARSSSITELNAAAPTNVGIINTGTVPTVPEASEDTGASPLPPLPSPTPPTPPSKSSNPPLPIPQAIASASRNVSMSSPTLTLVDSAPAVTGAAAGSANPLRLTPEATSSNQSHPHSHHDQYQPTQQQQQHAPQYPQRPPMPQSHQYPQPNVPGAFGIQSAMTQEQMQNGANNTFGRASHSSAPPPTLQNQNIASSHPNFVSASPPPPLPTSVIHPQNPSPHNQISHQHNHHQNIHQNGNFQQPHHNSYPIPHPIHPNQAPFPHSSHSHPHGFVSQQQQQNHMQQSQARAPSPNSMQRQMSLRGIPGSPVSPTSPTIPILNGPPGPGQQVNTQQGLVPMLMSTEDLHIQVLSSTIVTGDVKNKEVVSFQIQVRRNHGQPHQQAGGNGWRIEKVYSDVVTLDAKLRATLQKTVLARVGKPPEKSLYTTLNPAKSDQRKLALEMYLQRVADVATDSRDVIEFLSTNIVDGDGRTESVLLDVEGRPSGPPSTSTILKEGILVKKGKSFGGWKTRYFKCRATALEYYDTTGREIISTIKLRNCLVVSDKNNDTKSYHSFTLVEYKSGSFSQTSSMGPDIIPPESRVVAKHTLCAESDQERDEWVRIISKQIMETRPGARLDHMTSSAEVLDASNEGISGSTPVVDGSMDHISQHTIPQQQYRGREDSHQGPPQNPLKASAGSPALTVTTSAQTPSGYVQSHLHVSHHHQGPGHHQFNPRSPGTQYAPGQAQAAALQFLATHAPPTNRSGGLPTAPHPAAGFANAQSPDTAARQGRGFVDESARIMQQAPPPLAVEDPALRAQGRNGSSGGTGGLLSGSPRIDDKRGNASKRITTAFNWGKKKAISDFGLSGGGIGGMPGSAGRIPDPARVVFGVPLDQSVAVSRVNELYELPSVIYRCIEYLDAMRAYEEEGIYRLSGLSSIIQMLKDRFNNEGDIDLLGSGERYDVHAIAGLLKLYLRELQSQSPVLTKQLQKDFIRITEIQDRNDRITELGRLVSLLPLTNYTLLRVMIAHLIRVVQASDVNKMTVRNVGIVFSPTLGIPVVVLTLMMAEYELVFCWEDSQKSQVMREREREMAERLGRERDSMSRRQAMFEAEVEKAERERQQQQQQQFRAVPSPDLSERNLEKQHRESAGEGPSVIIMQPPVEDSEGMDDRSRSLAAKKARREQARMSMAPGLLMARNQNKIGGDERRSNRNSFIMIDDSVLPPRESSSSLTDDTGASDEEGHMLDMYTSGSLQRDEGSSDGDGQSRGTPDGMHTTGHHPGKSNLADGNPHWHIPNGNEVDFYEEEEEVIIDGEGEVYVDGTNASYRISEYFNAYDDAGVKPGDGVFARNQQGEEEYESELFG